jgi:hypothetical protein
VHIHTSHRCSLVRIDHLVYSGVVTTAITGRRDTLVFRQLHRTVKAHITALVVFAHTHTLELLTRSEPPNQVAKSTLWRDRHRPTKKRTMLTILQRRWRIRFRDHVSGCRYSVVASSSSIARTPYRLNTVRQRGMDSVHVLSCFLIGEWSPKSLSPAAQTKLLGVPCFYHPEWGGAG